MYQDAEDILVPVKLFRSHREGGSREMPRAHQVGQDCQGQREVKIVLFLLVLCPGLCVVLVVAAFLSRMGHVNRRKAQIARVKREILELWRKGEIKR